MQDQISQLWAELKKTLSPLLAQPATRIPPAKERKPRQKRPPVSTPRRSVRLGKGTRGSKATKQQALIIRKLCLVHEEDVIGDEALQAYVRLFDKPLVDSLMNAGALWMGRGPPALGP
ncbi:Wall-associated receptor kinase 5 [Hordeum vulgare]|nr:Wall-associated receptor kinase 5 [Hordeum vulgare]KAI4984321.1 hypothetical protein ZWY2020_057553 [Hordeum vulgare]